MHYIILKQVKNALKKIKANEENKNGIDG